MPVIASYGGVSLHEQSHGESFLALLEHRFGPRGLYILDEPEAALSPTGQMKVLARMKELVAQGAQFIIATHSPLLLAFADSLIYEIQEGYLVPTPYEQTRHYQLTKGFLDNYERVIDEL